MEESITGESEGQLQMGYVRFRSRRRDGRGGKPYKSHVKDARPGQSDLHIS